MLDILYDFGNRHLFSGSDFPSISIMAKLTAHQAALCKDDISDARTVNGAECFDRMNISIHDEDHLFLWRRSALAALRFLLVTSIHGRYG
ncbi:hypothetical protein CHCC14821_0685 [Bacillus paralicheniformis]|nr:hypothetical protein CHCC14821_0685 [Bacillus paralicheniformis]